MKKINTISALAFIICSAFNQSPMDYRDTYTGNYSCKFYNNHLTSPDMINVLDTGRITVTIKKDFLDSVVQINLGQQILKAKLVNNNLEPFPNKSHYGGKFFSTDSLSFSFSPTMSGSIRYIGKKI